MTQRSENDQSTYVYVALLEDCPYDMAWVNRMIGNDADRLVGEGAAIIGYHLARVEFKSVEYLMVSIHYRASRYIDLDTINEEEEE